MGVSAGSANEYLARARAKLFQRGADEPLYARLVEDFLPNRDFWDAESGEDDSGEATA